MNIGTRQIGEGHPVYVIAEVGGNHDGSLDQAFHLIDAARDAGADAAKFQLFNPNMLYPGRHTPGSIDPEWLDYLDDYCNSVGIDFLCSVFDARSLSAYLTVDPVAIKIASPEALNEELVRAAIATKVPVLISTGAMDGEDLVRLSHIMWRGLEETWPELRISGDFPNQPLLLHCVSDYPAKPQELNLRVLEHDRDLFLEGFSDHSLGIIAPIIAVALGALMIEKHITGDRAAPGPDHAFALEPDEFAAMVEAIREAELMLGDGVKRVQPSEDAMDRRAA